MGSALSPDHNSQSWFPWGRLCAFPQKGWGGGKSLTWFQVSLVNNEGKKIGTRSSRCGAMGLAVSWEHWDAGSISGLAQWVRIWCCCSCGLGPNCSLDLIPGSSICCGEAKKKKKKKKTGTSRGGEELSISAIPHLQPGREGLPLVIGPSICCGGGIALQLGFTGFPGHKDLFPLAQP